VLTVPVRTVRTATWQGRTIMLTWQRDDVAHFGWMLLSNTVMTRVIYGQIMCLDTWPNPLGATCPSHFWLYGWLFKNVLGSPRGSTPGPPPMQSFNKHSASQYSPLFLVYIPTHIYIKVCMLYYWKRGVGPGLSPDPWFHYNI
jgi:hypothetical protein